VPETPGASIRCALESLALLYRKTLLEVEQLTDAKIERLHLVGGGSRNALLNQLTANACQIPVHSGPTEATAVGNILVQAIALGHVQSLSKARSIVRDSFPVRVFVPCDAVGWKDSYARFLRLV
jgi:rhamnulokinase